MNVYLLSPNVSLIIPLVGDFVIGNTTLLVGFCALCLADIPSNHQQSVGKGTFLLTRLNGLSWAWCSAATTLNFLHLAE